jgi:hypothetical protein
MVIDLHKNARTTTAIRSEIAASSETAATLALRYGVSEGTVYKWKGRESWTSRWLCSSARWRAWVINGQLNALGPPQFPLRDIADTAQAPTAQAPT